jgi:uncharacterized protein
MPVTVNMRHLIRGPVRLEGELPAEEVVGEVVDELVHLRRPLRYELEVSSQGRALLVQGRLETTLDCECARCLKSFELPLVLPELATLAMLEGEDAVPQDGDFADLTPMLREDTFLALPTNPLCTPECRGLEANPPARVFRLEDQRASGREASPWTELDRLKL